LTKFQLAVAKLLAYILIVRIFGKALLTFFALCRDIFDTIHYYGGQVYLDGANMNAQVKLIHSVII